VSEHEQKPVSRMKALVMKSGLDRVPVIMSMGAYAAYISNMSSYEYYMNPKKAYEAQMWAKHLHQHDGGLSYNIPNSLVWDFGGVIEIPKSPRIALPKVIKRVVECPKDLENFKIPDLKTSIPAMKRKEFNKILIENGFGVSVSGGSPMGVAASIVGVELIMRWMYKEPELVHRLLRISTDYILKSADDTIAEFGVENCSAFSTYPNECHALISPKTFEKYSLPYVKEIHEKLIDKGIKKWTIHLCGDHTKNLDYWVKDIKLHPRSCITIGHEMDIEHVAKVFGEDHIIGGNINTTLLQLGSANEVYMEAKNIINKMKYHPGGFILAPACALSPITPPINLYAMLKAAIDFGTYN